MTLLIPREVDRRLRYPRGRSVKLANAGKLPCIKLPDGEIRFDWDAIERLLLPAAAEVPVVAQPAEAEHAA